MGYQFRMFGPRSLVRPLLAAPFLIGGINALRSPAVETPGAQVVGLKIAETAGLPTDPQSLAKINAGVQVGAGALLLFGIFSRPAALALGATLVPTALAVNRFWETDDADKRKTQIADLARNAGLLGGLLLAALDTGGRPSVFWSSRRAAGRAASSLSDAAHTVAESVGSAYHALPVGS